MRPSERLPQCSRTCLPSRPEAIENIFAARQLAHHRTRGRYSDLRAFSRYSAQPPLAASWAQRAPPRSQATVADQDSSGSLTAVHPLLSPEGSRRLGPAIPSRKSWRPKLISPGPFLREKPPLHEE